MIDLEIYSHLGYYKVFISKIKFFYIQDYNKKRSLINTFEGYFTKEKDSEFSTEMQLSSKIYSDGKLININDFNYYRVSEDFDLKNELKLGSKSLFLKYLEFKTAKIGYNENYQTLQYILRDLAEDIQEIISNDIKSISFNFHIDVEKKQILKLLLPELIKENYLANFLDITYDESIEFQLELLNAIIKVSNTKSIIILDLPQIKESWLAYMESFPENTYFLLFNSKASYVANKKDIFICLKNMSIDLFDDNALYELSMNENKNYTLEEYRTYLVNQLNIN